MSSTLKTKNWNDLKMMIAAISVTSTLGLWTLFAGSNRQGAIAKAASDQFSNPAVSILTQPGDLVAPLAFSDRILLGGPPPRSNNPSGGGIIAQTRSS